MLMNGKYLSVSHEFNLIENKYQSFRQMLRYGQKEKNCTVLDMMEQQHYLHVGIQVNSFDTRMNVFLGSIAFHFILL